LTYITIQKARGLLYSFDDNCPAFSKTNGILKPINIYGEILNIEDISALNFVDQHLKFIQSPNYDTLQFKITSRIIGGNSFQILTNMIILD
jgi:hypothetical protein